MTFVVAIIGLLLTGAWIDQALALRARRRRQRDKQAKWWTEPDDEGDY